MQEAPEMRSMTFSLSELAGESSSPRRMPCWGSPKLLEAPYNVTEPAIPHQMALTDPLSVLGRPCAPESQEYGLLCTQNKNWGPRGGWYYICISQKEILTNLIYQYITTVFLILWHVPFTWTAIHITLFHFKLYLSRSRAWVISSRRSLTPADQINCFLL